MSAVVLTAGTATATPAAVAHKQNLTLTNDANGQAVAARAGDDITVRLVGKQADGETWMWSTPTAGDDEVLRKTTSSVDAKGDASAVFHVQSGGTTTLASQMRCVSGPGQACPHAVMPWRVTVTAQ
ncbi:potassium-transporting ATPase subunit C [Streptomyces sp. NPDC052101]|uniref:potassium-transporting ATPase subunit C n=1 Tax=Streptomyces sp. NPDC052101 TaxID=3155763 RepID=UPI00341314AA